MTITRRRIPVTPETKALARELMATWAIQDRLEALESLPHEVAGALYHLRRVAERLEAAAMRGQP